MEELLAAAQIVLQTKKLQKEQGQVKIPVLGVSFFKLHDTSQTKRSHNNNTTNTVRTILMKQALFTNSIISFMKRSS
jgi:hypothetical protein